MAYLLFGALSCYYINIWDVTNICYAIIYTKVGLPMYRALAIDMDGTLLTHDKRVLSSSYNALCELQKLGKKVIFCTGRCPAMIERDRNNLPLPDVAICAGGAIVYDMQHKDVITQYGFSLDQVDKIFKAIEGSDYFWEIFSGTQFYYSKHLLPKIGNYFMGHYHQLFSESGTPVDNLKEFLTTLKNTSGAEANYAEANYAEENSAEANKVETNKVETNNVEAGNAKANTAKVNKTRGSNAKVNKINVHFSSVETRARLRPAFARLSQEENMETVDTETASIEFFTRDFNKGKTLLDVLKTLEIDPAECVALGDSDNDISMFEVVGMPIAMGNATQGAKAAAKGQVSDCDHDGVCEAIHTYLIT